MLGVFPAYLSDCKKNKGSILKNSVEYICALQRENQCYAGLYSEANLASSVINRLIKRIQVSLLFPSIVFVRTLSLIHPSSTKSHPFT